MGPDSEDGLFEFLKGKSREWQSSLSNYKSLADTGSYPGEKEITDGLSLLKALTSQEKSCVSYFLFSIRQPKISTKKRRKTGFLLTRHLMQLPIK